MAETGQLGARTGHPAIGTGSQSDYRRCGSVCGQMMGEQHEALVVDVTPWDVHGVGYVDVTIALRDRTLETARLGKESREPARPSEAPRADPSATLPVVRR